MPQSMQRAPCAFSSGSASGSWYSSKSCRRSGTGRFGPLTRWIFRKPPTSPIAREDLLGGLGLGLFLLSAVYGAPACLALGPLGRHGGVLVLAGLAGALRLLVAVGRGRVWRALARTHGPVSGAIAVLGDHGRLAGLLGAPLG